MNEIRNFVIQKVFGWYSQFLDLCKTKFKNDARVKLISVTYWIKLWLVTQAQWSWHIWMYYSLMCVWIATCWFPTYWESYEMQYVSYLSVRRYNSVNSFSTAYPVVFQMKQFMPHGMCPVHACCSCVLSSCVSWETECHEDAYVESSAFVGCKFQRLVENLRYCWCSCW